MAVKAKVIVDGVDNASGAVKAAAQSTDYLNDALLKLIKTEKQAAASKEAEAKFKTMSQAEKDAALAAEQLAAAQRKANDEIDNTPTGALTDLKSAIDLVAGAADAAAQVISELWAAGKEGAAVNQMNESFDGLIEKVGASTTLLEELRRASGHTVDNMTLMSSTATLLAGTTGELAKELAGATPELLEIAKAAQKLNPTLGDTTFLYDSIATGIKRASPMILDNLGLTIKIGEANEKYAAKLGKAVDALTAEEQKMALLQETLRAGQVLIGQAGGNADSATDSFARMEAATKNLGDALKSKLAGPIGAVADGLARMMAGDVDAVDALKITGGEVLKTASSYEVYRSQLEKAANTAGYWVDEQGRLRGKNLELMDSNYLLSESEFYAAQQGDFLAREMGNVESQIGYARRAMDAAAVSATILKLREIELADEQARIAESFDLLSKAVNGKFGKEIDNFKDKMIDLEDETIDLQGEIDELESKPYLTEEQKEQLENLKTKLGENKQAMAELKEEHDRSMRSMAFDMLTQRAQSDGLTENEVNNLTTIAEKWGLWDETTANVVSAINDNIGLLDTDRPMLFASTIEGILNADDYKQFKFYVDIMTRISGSGLPNPGAGTPGNDPSNRCFVGDTPVITPAGPRLIGELQAGDTVTVLTDGGLVEASIVQVMSAYRDDLVRVDVSDGQTFYCSPNHPFKTQRGFVWASRLEAFDKLISTTPGLFVLGVCAYPGTHQVFDLHIDHPDHTFLVGSGLVVHNKEAGLVADVPRGLSGIAINGNIVLPGVTNPQDFVNELGAMAAGAYRAGLGYAGR
jgi:hypothetical protein